MARIRSLHPKQWTDAEFMELSPYAKLMAIGLRNEADDRGVFAWKPGQLKVRILPMDKFDEVAIMKELSDANIIMVYEMNGQKLGAIRNFMLFQSPRVPSFTHPVTKSVLQYVCFNRKKGVSDQSSEEPIVEKKLQSPIIEAKPFTPKSDNGSVEGIGIGKGIGIGEEKKEVEVEVAAAAAPSPPKEKLRGSRLPPDWVPKEEHVTKLIEQGMGKQVFENELEKFMNYWKAKAGAHAVKMDWDATYLNWMARVREDGKFNGT